MNSPATGPDSGQIIVMVGMALTTLIVIVVGVLITTRRLRWSTRSLVGLGPGLILGGVALGMFTVDVVTGILTNDVTNAPFRKWWFLPQPQPGDWLYSFIASPYLVLFVIAILVTYFGFPTPTKIRAFIAPFRVAQTRPAAVRKLVYGIIVVIGGVAGGIIGGLIGGRILAVAGTFVVGFAVFIVAAFLEEPLKKIFTRDKGARSGE